MSNHDGSMNLISTSFTVNGLYPSTNNLLVGPLSLSVFDFRSLLRFPPFAISTVNSFPPELVSK